MSKLHLIVLGRYDDDDDHDSRSEGGLQRDCRTGPGLTTVTRQSALHLRHEQRATRNYIKSDFAPRAKPTLLLCFFLLLLSLLTLCSTHQLPCCTVLYCAATMGSIDRTYVPM